MGHCDFRELRVGTNKRRKAGATDFRHFQIWGDTEVVIKPELLRGFHNDPETKQSYIMAAVGREVADFDMSREDAKQFCRAMIENLFGRAGQTVSHLETAFFHGFKKHLGYDAVHERVLMRRGVPQKR